MYGNTCISKHNQIKCENARTVKPEPDGIFLILTKICALILEQENFQAVI